ncbi:CHAT domain-containing protein [Methylibium sp.]|uniref:CHAT domain-containing protein n=1 Tax=Methylibium sp. TaxID=2067992 RepID=UPI003D15208A
MARKSSAKSDRSETADANPVAPNGDRAFDLWCDAHLAEGSSVQRQQRSAPDASRGLDPAQLGRDGAVLEVRFADGSVFYTDPVEFVSRHARPQAARRGAAGGAAAIELPFDLAPSTQTRSRGGAPSAPVERYTVSELTDPTSLDKLYDFASILGHAVGRWFPGGAPQGFPLAAKLCASFENANLHEALGNEGGVLLRWTDGAWQAAGSLPLADAKERVLVFLHGTASSTEGSFGKLWAGESGGLPGDFKALAERCTLLAWEHRSLTRSPVDNTLGLVEALLATLPAERQFAVDVVSHSRGGLVGELFALRSAATLTEAQRFFASRFAAVGERAQHPDAPLLRPLFAALGNAAQRLQPGCFVRVACPARGTLLADGRTDLFLSLLLRAIGLAVGSGTGGLGSLVFDRATRLVRSLVAARADARAVPGLEAMIPGSPLTLALAGCGAQPRDRLRVIAGDSRGKGWGGIVTLLGDVFYGLHDHDFVVHTRSMFGGLQRSAQPPRSLRCEGPTVTHFAYFGAGSLSRSGLLNTLAGRDDGFASLADDERRTRGLPQALKPDPLSRRPFDDWLADFGLRENARKPVLLVLPGIMGSELQRRDGDERVWLALDAMLDGSLERLALEDPDARADGSLLRASGLLAVSYERLLDEARARFRVVAVPFDWRLSIEHSGAGLREQLLAVVNRLNDPTVPVHLLVHSMGGLIARQALYVDAAGKALWQALKQRGSRLVMLGTPNKGSYAPAMLLLRQYPLATMLAVLARKVSDRDMARFGAGFPGLLQMLPQDSDAAYGDLFDPASWQRVAEDEHGAQLPDPGVLKTARDFVRGPFKDSLQVLCEDPSVFYVAGTGSTVLAMRKPQNAWETVFGEGETVIATRRGVDFLAGPGGDGTVPWNSTLAPERTWYAPCEHGTLPDHRESFEAYFELLSAGRTHRLPQQAPQSRGAPAGDAALAVVPPTPRPGLLPADDEELAAYILARGSDAPPEVPTPEPIEVRVVHGGLDFARYPLMVGHYENDGVFGAAKRVDEKLGGQLQQVLDLKLFVGASRTGHYLRPNNHTAKPPAYPGALMLGLGSVGELTPGLLSETVTRGVLRFAFEHVHRDPYSPAGSEPVDLRLSTVLVGTHVQAVTARDSLAGLLYGVWRAAQLLLQLPGQTQPVRIREVEVIEIDEHIALDAAYELKRLLARDEWRERLRWDHPVLEVREGGIRGYRPRATGSVWQRLIIEHDALGGLKFALIGERARVESTQVYSDVASLRRFIDRVSDHQTTAADRIASPTDPRFGGVLFQMLLPYDLKERLANLDNTVLVVDDESARYPWELLSPPLSSAADGETPRPFVVHAGLVRQRVTKEFRRLLPQAIGGYDALIVGAPSTAKWQDAQGAALQFSTLDGAQAEAQAVNELLQHDHREWLPAALIGPAVSFDQVRIALLEKPYRLLHLCGHGVVDQWVRTLGSGLDAREIRKTGMVLSNQEVLTAADVEQMSPAPEFVFINCCYSGRDSEGLTNPGPDPRKHPILAASLALQFIKMGSKAVVAAGWQVDDAAALLFARTLYRGLLDGDPFGEAVRVAREAVHAESGAQNNTWGAYQCYGDPQWRLRAPARSGGAAAGTSLLRDADGCMSAHELADRIVQVVAVAGDKPPAAVLGQIDKLLATLEADDARCAWLTDSRVRSALGCAYRELGDHDSAARALQLGARSAYSQVQIGQLELLVNSLSRSASPDAQGAAERLLDRLDDVSNDTLGRWPLGDQDVAPTSAASERQCLRGGFVLRQAARLLDEDKALGAVAGALAEAARRFASAYRSKRHFKDSADRRAYALSNALLAAALAALAQRELGVAEAALAEEGPPRDGELALGPVALWLAEARALLDELAALDDLASFWHQTTKLELLVARTLLAHLQDDSYPLDDLGLALDLLDRALVRWPSPIQLESLQHRFLLAGNLSHALLHLPGPHPWEDLRQALPVLTGEALARLAARSNGSH